MKLDSRCRQLVPRAVYNTRCSEGVRGPDGEERRLASATSGEAGTKASHAAVPGCGIAPG
jgi:hypothetical protein